jgi:hypothetical protein
MSRSIGGLARGEMASHVIDGQRGTYDVGSDVSFLARNAVVIDPVW